MYWNNSYFIYDPFERILIEELIGRVMDVLTEKQKVVFLEHCIYGKSRLPFFIKCLVTEEISECDRI